VTQPTYYYGSHAKAGAPDYIYPTTAVVRELLGPWAEVLASYIPQLPIGAIETYSFCNQPPPPSDLTEIGLLALARVGPTGGAASLVMVANWIRGQLWPIYCEMDPPPGPEMPPGITGEPPPLPDIPTDTALPPPPEPIEGPDLAAQLAAQLRVLQGAVSQLTWLQDNVQLRNAILGEEWDISQSGMRTHRPALGYLVTLTHLNSGIGKSQAEVPRVFSAGYASYGRMMGFGKFRWANWRDNVRLARDYNLVWTDGLLADCMCWELAPQVTGHVMVLEQPSISIE
jgi:hypothetical protein